MEILGKEIVDDILQSLCPSDGEFCENSPTRVAFYSEPSLEELAFSELSALLTSADPLRPTELIDDLWQRLQEDEVEIYFQSLLQFFTRESERHFEMVDDTAVFISYTISDVVTSLLPETDKKSVSHLEFLILSNTSHFLHEVLKIFSTHSVLNRKPEQVQNAHFRHVCKCLSHVFSLSPIILTSALAEYQFFELTLDFLDRPHVVELLLLIFGIFDIRRKPEVFVFRHLHEIQYSEILASEIDQFCNPIFTIRNSGKEYKIEAEREIMEKMQLTIEEEELTYKLHQFESLKENSPIHSPMPTQSPLIQEVESPPLYSPFVYTPTGIPESNFLDHLSESPKVGDENSPTGGRETPSLAEHYSRQKKIVQLKSICEMLIRIVESASRIFQSSGVSSSNSEEVRMLLLLYRERQSETQQKYEKNLGLDYDNQNDGLGSLNSGALQSNLLSRSENQIFISSFVSEETIRGLFRVVQLLECILSENLLQKLARGIEIPSIAWDTLKVFETLLHHSSPPRSLFCFREKLLKFCLASEIFSCFTRSIERTAPKKMQTRRTPQDALILGEMTRPSLQTNMKFSGHVVLQPIGTYRTNIIRTMATICRHDPERFFVQIRHSVWKILVYWFFHEDRRNDVFQTGCASIFLSLAEKGAASQIREVFQNLNFVAKLIQLADETNDNHSGRVGCAVRVILRLHQVYLAHLPHSRKEVAKDPFRTFRFPDFVTHEHFRRELILSESASLQFCPEKLDKKEFKHADFLAKLLKRNPKWNSLEFNEKVLWHLRRRRKEVRMEMSSREVSELRQKRKRQLRVDQQKRKMR